MFEHVNSIFTILFAAHGLALVIVNMTKTPKDDQAVAAVYKVIEMLAGIISPRVKK